MGFKPDQLIIILILVLVLFGGSKIPEMMRGLGQGMKEFKKATRDEDEPTPAPKPTETRTPTDADRQL